MKRILTWLVVPAVLVAGLMFVAPQSTECGNLLAVAHVRYVEPEALQ